jgi:6-pyruvoyltetrahydropterin/6-carboxytetrahydropterin synthase
MEVMEVTKTFEFDAAHRLCSDSLSESENKEVFGPCFRLHGHRYVLHVTIKGPPDPKTGMVINFTELSKTVKNNIVNVLDHQFLNDIIEGPVTCENTLVWIKRRLLPTLPSLQRLTLYETPTSYATLELVNKIKE